jgi:hypothetical protein
MLTLIMGHGFKRIKKTKGEKTLPQSHTELYAEFRKVFSALLCDKLCVTLRLNIFMMNVLVP